MDRHLVVFARQPRLGRVKTRLAQDIGRVDALRFYRACLRKVTRALADQRWRCWLAVTPDLAARTNQGRSDHLPTGTWRCLPQGGGDLEQRLMRPLRTLPPGPVVMVGSDAPDVNAEQIAKAFALLGDHHAVFGPATDGGFWLVGLSRRPRLSKPFANVRWSTPDALGDCLANLKDQKVGVVQTLEDVDDGDSYARCSLRRGINSTKLHGR